MCVIVIICVTVSSLVDCKTVSSGRLRSTLYSSPGPDAVPGTQHCSHLGTWLPASSGILAMRVCGTSEVRFASFAFSFTLPLSKWLGLLLSSSL